MYNVIDFQGFKAEGMRHVVPTVNTHVAAVIEEGTIIAPFGFTF